MPTVRPALVVGSLLTSLALAGCGGAPTPPAGSGSSGDAPASAQPSGPGVGSGLLEGLDVCSLVTPDLVRRAVGQSGEPTSRLLGRVRGYDGVTDQCGFGVSFDSFTLTVDVGLAPVAPRDLERITEAARGATGTPSLEGVGTAARAFESEAASGVVFVRGSTFVRVRAARRADAASRLSEVVAVAREVAGRVPDDPPASDAQTKGACTGLDPEAVAGVLGAPVAVSRSIAIATSSECSFATGVGADARIVTVAVYGNQQAGPFFEAQQDPATSEEVPGVEGGSAFTVPGAAYLVADDGQAVSVGGRFGPTGPARRPLAPTPELAALLTSAAGLMQ